MRIDPSHDSADVTVNETLEELEPIGEVPAVPIGDGEIVQPAMLEIEEPTEAMISAVAGENPEIRQEQLQLEAAQLAEHLRERLCEIDRREAMVHARVAQLESDLRTSRIWLAERHAEFESREAELLYQITDLQEQAAQRGQEIGTAELAAEARHIEYVQRDEDLRERAEQLQQREDELGRQRLEVDRQAAEIMHAQHDWRQQRGHEERRWADECRREAQQLEADRSQMTQQFDQAFAEREEHVRTAEFLLNEHAEELERERAAFLADQKAWEEQKSRQRQAIDELRAATEAELADRRLRLDARQEWIERQKAGLEQVRDEALSLHRQSMEMRLIAEQAVVANQWRPRPGTSDTGHCPIAA